MKLSRRRALFLAAWSPALAAAQTPAPPPVPDKPEAVFPKLFPQPTGDNGYEEIVQAGDLAWASRLVLTATSADTTLRQKRDALADPKVSRALGLLKRGLAKPIRSPRAAFTPGTLFPDFASLRGLARLLGVYQYVALADGRTADAIGALRDGLLLAQTVKGEVLIGGLVGAAIESIVLTRLARHLDQMTARDCDRLVALAREYLAAPDAAIAALETERGFETSALDALRKDASSLKFGEFFGDATDAEDDEDASTEPLNQQWETLVKNDPAAPERIADAAEAKINAYYDALIAAQRLLPFQRTGNRAEPPPPPGNQPDAPFEEQMALRLVSLLLPIVSRATDRFTQVRVQVQLLGVHGAVRRFRWERDKLPDALADLRLPPELAVDPYSGQPLVYQKTGDTIYALSSAGPPERDEAGNVVPGKRTPILLPAPPRPTAPG